MNLLTRIRQNPISIARLLAFSAVIVVLLFNYPFIKGVYEATQPSNLSEWLFVFSVPVLLFGLTVVLFSLIGAFIVPRLIIGLSLFISGALLYATSTYGIIFDRAMIQNIVETNPGEAASYVNVQSLGFVVILGLVPMLLVWLMPLKKGLLKQLAGLLKLNILATAATLLVVFVFYQDYASVGRNNHQLVKYIVPFAFYDSSYKYLRDHYLAPPLPYRKLDEHPVKITESSKPRTLVLVVGETARAANFSLNGYARLTNPFLTSKNVISFTRVSSCGTATAISVPCMFSRMGREDYDDRLALSQDNVLDILQRANYEVTWIDNNSSCKGVCNHIPTIEFDPQRDPALCDGDFCLDDILLNELSERLKQQPDRDRVVVLHMIGSHGPGYYQRYPSSFRKFTPECHQSDINHCTEEQLRNTYDNTIAYTDYVLSRIIDMLNEEPTSNNAMLYISDHGESLGENGLYLHGFPYSLAPEEQTHVAMIYWDNRFSQENYYRCVNQHAGDPISHDNLFDTVLDLADIHSSAYHRELDILDACHTFRVASTL
jgi:lipid A ethanolaminephosphotransferase